MADRTVKVDLVSDVSRYKSGMMEAAASTKALGDVVEAETDKMGRHGEKGGGLLAQGVRTGIMRNSPLIVAGIGAALAVGAPAMLAGAAVLFAGLGAAAAAQTEEVREAWSDLGDDIKAGAVEDAAVLVPVFAGAADKIGAAYQRLRPEIRDAFAASAPLVDTFTDSLTRAAELAMPGLVNAVQAGGPVIDGLGTLLEDVGQGVSDFFDALAENPEAAGASLEALGDILGELLPLLGELLGTGTELASEVLPPIASALGAVADAASALGPLLPIIVAGFAGMRIGNKLGDMLGTMADRMANVGTAGSRLNTTTMAMSSSLRGIAALLPVAGAAFAAWNQHVQQGDERMQEAQATAAQMFDLIEQGGDKAAKGAKGIQVMEEQIARLREAGFDEAADKMQAGLDAAKDAADRAAYSQQNFADKTNAATRALADQANQALAASNSELGYQQAIDGLQGSQEAYTAAIRDHGAASEEASDASLDLATNVLAASAAAGQMAADSLPATTSELQRTTAANQATLAELYRLRDEMGSNFPAAANTTIARLEAAGVTLDATSAAASGVAQQMSALGAEVVAIPGQKFVRIDAPTDAQRKAIADLGYQVINLPNGDIYVAADTASANAAIDYAARGRTSVIRVTTVGGNSVQTYSNGMSASANAVGRIMEAGHGFADGGFANVRTFDPSIAQVFPPNQIRFAGDRIRDDEAYIPINGSARSRAILESTMARMGYGGASGGGATAVNIAGATLSGTLQIDGMPARMTAVVVDAVTTIIDRGAYNP